MKAFRVILTIAAPKDVKHLDPTIQTRLLDKLEWMGQNAELLRHQALRGVEWSGSFTAWATTGSFTG